MKDRSILSALYDEEIHSPFREKCQMLVEESEELKAEFLEIEALSRRLKNSPEPDFERGKAAALAAVLKRASSKQTKKILRPHGFFVSWPLAAAAALVFLVTGALTTGYSLRSGGLEVGWNQAPGLPASEYLSQRMTSSNPSEITVSVPRKFTLPTGSDGQLLLSSFEGGQ